jgi:hypothetical protein
MTQDTAMTTDKAREAADSLNAAIYFLSTKDRDDLASAVELAQKVLRHTAARSEPSDEAIIDAIKLHVRMRTSAQLTGGYEAVEVLPSVVDALRGLGVASQPAAGTDPLSSRLRPNVECAPWVIEEVKKLEAQLQGPSPAVSLDKSAEVLVHFDGFMGEQMPFPAEMPLEQRRSTRIAAMRAALRAAGMAQVPVDVINLVLAARTVSLELVPDLVRSSSASAQVRNDALVQLRALDRAAEAFASRIPWDNEPDEGDQ